jgi:[ribosomal protein S5]-alanine N-acetyltransferase
MCTLTTERLLLRSPHLLDAGPLFAVFGDAEVMRFGDGVQTHAWVERWVQAALEQHHRLWGFGPLVVIERASRAVLGYCGLFYFADLGGQPEVELGYRLARAAWGCGYATEAACAIRDHAADTLGLRRLVALIDPANRASLRVAAKLGMAYEREVLLAGYTHPDHLYAVALDSQPAV